MLKGELTPQSLNVKLGSRRKPSRGLLRDYEPSDGTFSSTSSNPPLLRSYDLCNELSAASAPGPAPALGLALLLLLRISIVD